MMHIHRFGRPPLGFALLLALSVSPVMADEPPLVPGTAKVHGQPWPGGAPGTSGPGAASFKMDETGELATTAAIDPFDSDTDLIGLDGGKFGLSINELSGKLTYSLPAVGVDGLSVTPTYKLDNRDRDHGVLAEDIGGQPLGPSWHLGFGYLVSQRFGIRGGQFGPELHQEKVVMVSSQGEVIPFEVDWDYQDEPAPVWQTRALITELGLCSQPGQTDCVPPGPLRDAHFIDGSLRRLTRQIYDPSSTAIPPDRLPFGYGQYRLLATDGSTVIFSPSSFEGLDPSNSLARFFPTTITSAAGRVLHLDYCGTLETERIARMCEVTDDWGRSLLFLRDLEDHPHLVTRIRLRAPGGESKPLAFFDYDSAGRLSRFKTAAGYQTTFAYDPSPSSPLDSLAEITTPNGGRIELTYAEARFLVRRQRPFVLCPNSQCDPPPEQNVEEHRNRLETVSYDPGRDLPAARFKYDYRHTCWNGDQGPQCTGPEIEHSRVEITVSRCEIVDDVCEAVTEGELYQRKTLYYGPSLHALDWQTVTPAVGLPFERETTYRSRFDSSPATVRREKWRYETLARDDAAFGLAPGTLTVGRKYVNAYSRSLDEGRLIYGSPLTVAYAVEQRGRLVELDPQWIETVFLYEDTLTQGLHTAPTRSARVALCGEAVCSPSERLLRHFEYEHRVRSILLDHDQEEEAEATHVIGLRTRAEADFIHRGGEVEPQGLIETTYKSDLPLVSTVIRRATDGGLAAQTPDIVQQFSYHEQEPQHGLLESEKVGPDSSKTEYLDYRYGVPSTEIPPVGSPVSRPAPDGIDLYGRVARETANGATTLYTFDLDSRPRTEEPEDGSQAPREMIYTGPGHPDPATRTEHGEQMSTSFFDGFGRTWKERTWIEGSLFGTTQSFFSPLGLQDLTLDARGTSSHTVFDAHGRPIQEWQTDSSGRRLRETRRQYEALQDHTTTTVTVDELDQLGALVDRLQTITTADLAGRPLEVTTTRHGRSAVSTEFLYEAPNITRIRPEGLQDLERSSASNWLGQLLWEEHPEIDGRISYSYDDRGQLIEEVGPGYTFRFERDAGGRLQRKVRVLPGGQEVVVAEHGYHPLWNVADFSSSEHGVTLAVPAGEWDSRGRPLARETSIPDLSGGPGDLLHQVIDDDLELSWSAAGTGALRQVEVELREEDTVVWSAVLPVSQASIPDHVVVPAGQWVPEATYEWRVRTVDTRFQPSAWSVAPIIPDSSQGSTGPGSTQVDGILITPPALFFGALPVGETATLPLTVYNSNTFPVEVTVSYLGPPFSVSPSSISVAAETVLDFQVSFAPTAEQAFAQFAQVLTDLGGGAEITLSGEGFAAGAPQGEMWIPGPPQSSTNYLDLDFGYVFVDQQTERFTAIKNVGGAGTVLRDIELAFSDSRFSVVQEVDSWPCVLDNAEWCYPKIRFRPGTTAGVVAATASFAITRDDGSRQEIVVALRARAVESSQIKVRAPFSSAALSQLDLGKISVAQQGQGFFRVFNTGGIPVQVTLEADSPFEVVGNVACLCPVSDPDCQSFGPMTTTNSPMNLDVILPPQQQAGFLAGTLEIRTRDFCTQPEVPRTELGLSAQVVATPPLDIQWGPKRFPDAGLYSSATIATPVTVTNVSSQWVAYEILGRGDLATVVEREIVLQPGSSYTHPSGLSVFVPKLGEYRGDVCLQVDGLDPVCEQYSGFGLPIIRDWLDNWDPPHQQAYAGEVMIWEFDPLTSELLTGTIETPEGSALRKIQGAVEVQFPRPNVAQFTRSWFLGGANHNLFEVHLADTTPGLRQAAIRMQGNLEPDHFYAPGMHVLRDFPLSYEILPVQFEHDCCDIAPTPVGSSSTTQVRIRSSGPLPLDYAAFFVDEHGNQVRYLPFTVTTNYTGTLLGPGHELTLDILFEPEAYGETTLDLVFEHRLTSALHGGRFAVIPVTGLGTPQGTGQ